MNDYELSIKVWIDIIERVSNFKSWNFKIRTFKIEQYTIFRVKSY